MASATIAIVKDPPPYFRGEVWLSDFAKFINDFVQGLDAEMKGSVLEITITYSMDFSPSSNSLNKLFDYVKALAPFGIKRITPTGGLTIG